MTDRSDSELQSIDRFSKMFELYFTPFSNDLKSLKKTVENIDSDTSSISRDMATAMSAISRLEADFREHKASSASKTDVRGVKSEVENIKDNVGKNAKDIETNKNLHAELKALETKVDTVQTACNTLSSKQETQVEKNRVEIDKLSHTRSQLMAVVAFAMFVWPAILFLIKAYIGV